MRSAKVCRFAVSTSGAGKQTLQAARVFCLFAPRRYTSQRIGELICYTASPGVNSGKEEYENNQTAKGRLVFCMKTPSPEHLEKLLYDRKSAAFALSISMRALDYLIAKRSLLTRRLGKKVMIPAGELKRFAAADHFESVKEFPKAA